MALVIMLMKKFASQPKFSELGKCIRAEEKHSNHNKSI